MTKEEQLEWLEQIEKDIYVCSLESTLADDMKSCAIHSAIEALKVQSCEDAVSREAAIATADFTDCPNIPLEICKQITDEVVKRLKSLPPVTPKPRLCKDCKFFEYDHVENVDGIPLIVANEICNKWGDGCQTEENGYCFLFKPKMEGEKHE